MEEDSGPGLERWLGCVEEQRSQVGGPLGEARGCMSLRDKSMVKWPKLGTWTMGQVLRTTPDPGPSAFCMRPHLLGAPNPLPRSSVPSLLSPCALFCPLSRSHSSHKSYAPSRVLAKAAILSCHRAPSRVPTELAFLSMKYESLIKPHPSWSSRSCH